MVSIPYTTILSHTHMFSNNSRCAWQFRVVTWSQSEMEGKGEEEGYGELERVVDQRNEQSHAWHVHQGTCKGKLQ